MDFGPDGVPAEFADEIRAEGIECGDAAIDVEIALFSGGEGEISGADGFFEEQGFQRGGGGMHGFMLEISGGGGKRGVFWYWPVQCSGV